MLGGSSFAKWGWMMRADERLQELVRESIREMVSAGRLLCPTGVAAWTIREKAPGADYRVVEDIALGEIHRYLDAAQGVEGNDGD